MPEHPKHSDRWNTFCSLLATVVVLLCLSSCRMRTPLALTPEEQSWLAAHEGQLEVLLEEKVPPYSFVDETGTFQGFFLDYLQEIERILGMPLVIRKFALWSDLLTYAKDNRNFIILNISSTDEREQYLLFTDTIIKIPYAIITRKTSQAKSIPEFVGKQVCTVENYAIIDDLARYYPNITPTGVTSSVRGLHAVSSGDCDLMVINQMEASFLIESLGLTNLHIAGQTHFLNRLAAATSVHDPILFSILEKTMDQITPSRRREIYRHWVSPGGFALPHTLVIILEAAIGAVLCIIFLLWAWTSSLRQRVAKQTNLIRQSRENLRITLNSIGDGVLATDTTGKITNMNPVAVALTGWAEAEAKEKPLVDVFPLKDIHSHQPVTPPDLSACEEDEKKTSTHEAILVSRDEALHRIHYTISPIRDEACNTTGTVLVFRDITDKIKAEEKLLRIKKFESIGILAGGIAHDFNNLLTGLYGNISMAKMALSPGHEAMDYLISAEETMEDAVALTGQFLTFSKDQKPVRKVIDLRRALAEAATFASHGLNTGLKLAIDPDLWPVSADKGQLNQVMSNLIINAHQAMKTGGITTLTATNLQNASERKVRITVQDTGSGIDPEHLDKIFDPYFTTKKTGSGLGLATSYAIITKHGGTINVESRLGEGTTITIDLPASSEPLPEAPPDTLPGERLETLVDPRALKAHILVLDDQVVIRKILETILTKLGLEVTFTVEGSETVEAYRKRLEEGRPFDAVVLDLTIPGGMGGQEASEKILAMDPKAKIIISSGHAADPIMSRYEEYGIRAVAVKPYRFSDFKEILLRVLLER